MYIIVYIYNSSSYGKPIIHGIINGKDWKSVQNIKNAVAPRQTPSSSNVEQSPFSNGDFYGKIIQPPTNLITRG